MVWTTRTIGLSLAGVALVGGWPMWPSARTRCRWTSSTVVRAPLSVTIDADGQTRIRNLYEVASPIAGTARRPRWRWATRWSRARPWSPWSNR
jgi:HlyD family secretion protein